MKLSCSQTLQAIVDNRPALPPNGRLAKALSGSGLDGPVTLLCIAYKESRFDPKAANPGSTAQGLFQFLAGTADDIQDRVVKNFLAPGTTIPTVPAGGRFADHRDDPPAAAFCAWSFLLDRIAHEGNDLAAGLDGFGTGDGYGDLVLQAVFAVRATAHLPLDQPTDLIILTKTVAEKCPEVQAALNKVFNY